MSIGFILCFPLGLLSVVCSMSERSPAPPVIALEGEKITEEQEEKTFEGGFFSVKSPVRTRSVKFAVVIPICLPVYLSCNTAP